MILKEVPGILVPCAEFIHAENKQQSIHVFRLRNNLCDFTKRTHKSSSLI